MRPLESGLQNIPKTKSVLCLSAFLGSLQLRGRGFKGQGLLGLLIQRVRGPETLACGTPHPRSRGGWPETLASPSHMLRA